MVKLFLFDLDQTLLDSRSVSEAARVHDWDYVRRHLDKVKPHMGSNAVLAHKIPDQLKALGKVIGIITNSPRWYAQRLIEEFDITNDVLVSSCDCSRAKPDPEPIVRALQICNRPSNDAIMIGDSADDRKAAENAAVRFVGATWISQELTNCNNIEVIACPSKILNYARFGEAIDL